jgi:ArsR family transcriptional regulator, arsenate/arsenite/antimonite-responsive transcriptional repressor / arsenate reductase (thioredoxin)
MVAKRRILFVCTGNAARSQIAEALLRHMASDIFEVVSAGTHPNEVDAGAIEALHRHGISTEGLHSKSLHTALMGAPFDCVITLCDKALQECSTLSGLAETLHWDIPSPKLRTDADPYHKTMLLLAERIKMFVLVNRKNT